MFELLVSHRVTTVFHDDGLAMKFTNVRQGLGEYFGLDFRCNIRQSAWSFEFCVDHMRHNEGILWENKGFSRILQGNRIYFHRVFLQLPRIYPT